MKQRVQSMIDEVTKSLHEVPELTHIGNPVLRQRCIDVTVDEGNSIAQQLIEVLDRYKKLNGVGAGLAAPQIGIAKNVFVTTGKDGYDVFVNPEIMDSSREKCFYRESCLSSRMLWGDVERPESITMKWLDENGMKHEERFDSFKARLLQHEYDHLCGICCIDKAISGTIEYSGDVKGEKMRKTHIK